MHAKDLLLRSNQKVDHCGTVNTDEIRSEEDCGEEEIKPYSMNGSSISPFLAGGTTLFVFMFVSSVVGLMCLAPAPDISWMQIRLLKLYLLQVNKLNLSVALIAYCR